MDSKKLSARSKQPGHDRSFEVSEQNFVQTLRSFLPDAEYEVTEKPGDLRSLFPKVDGSKDYGIEPEACITSKKTRKKLFFEVKKQAKKGNADERACRHHTVQFQKTLRNFLGCEYHAYFTVFCEDLATHPRYTTKHPYIFEPGHYFLWVDYDVGLLQGWIRDICQKFIDS